MTHDECCECDRPARHTGADGEPLCEQHWREAGMYDPRQGFEVTQRDREMFARSR